MSIPTSKSSFPLKKILVSTDGSENAMRALDAAIQLAKAFSAELFVVSVAPEIVPSVYSPIGVATPALDYSQFLEAAEKDAKRIVDQAVQSAKQGSVNAKGEAFRTLTSVAETIIEAADKENADLIVVGTRGLGGFKKLLLGSVSSAVVSHANCAVLVVR